MSHKGLLRLSCLRYAWRFIKKKANTREGQALGFHIKMMKEKAVCRTHAASHSVMWAGV